MLTKKVLLLLESGPSTFKVQVIISTRNPYTGETLTSAREYKMKIGEKTSIAETMMDGADFGFDGDGFDVYLNSKPSWVSISYEGDNIVATLTSKPQGETVIKLDANYIN